MKVLCIGNNTVDTDIRTSQLAEAHTATSFGLLSELDGEITILEPLPGYYHSSVYDIEYHRLLTLASKFDLVVILDQPREQYSHPDAFYQTIRLANELSLTCVVKFLDPTYNTAINFFEKLVTTNKSFCIFPFIELLAKNGSTTVCCRSSKEVTRLADLTDFQKDPNYTDIRNKMIAGELLPDHCATCYRLEDQGILSSRIQETVEWANRIGVTSLDDLGRLTSPVYYEVRASNKCNLQCRMCNPASSHLIAKEYATLKFINLEDFANLEHTNFDFIDFTNLTKLYIAGGEPTIMTEFYDFLDQCIENKQTDFELLINTNGTKLSERFKKQLTYFKTVSFIVSIDGYAELNHYIRWPSDWHKIVTNVEYLYKHFFISINITVSIYNILKLHELINFIDTNFPKAVVHCQFAESTDGMLSALNFPYSAELVDQLVQIQNLNCYKNDKLLSSFVDGLINHYQLQPKVNLLQLQYFFEFNDQLDNSRNIALIDYVPELDKARHLIQPSN
jgi:sulfatase maturation enzyme AslB (radical SAM superfamily)